MGSEEVSEFSHPYRYTGAMRKRLLIGMGLLLVLTPALLLTLSPPAHAPHTSPAPLPSADVPAFESPALPPHDGEPESPAESAAAEAAPPEADVRQPRVQPDEGVGQEPQSRTVLFQVVDDESGAPVADTPVRFAELEWDQGRSHATLAAIPTAVTPGLRTSETGKIALPDPPADPDEEWIPDSLYPVPWGWWPVTPSTQVWNAVNSARRGESNATIQVRLKRGPVLKVLCVDENGERMPDVTIVAMPHELDAHDAGMMFVDNANNFEELLGMNGKPLPPRDQHGKGTPEGVTFKVEADEYFEPPDSAWMAETDASGVATLTGLPTSLSLVSAWVRGRPLQVKWIHFTDDSELEFRYGPTASLELEVIVLDDYEEDLKYGVDFTLTGRSFDYIADVEVDPAGNRTFQVKLEDLAPGTYDIDTYAGGSLWHLAAGRNSGTVWLSSEDLHARWHCTVTVNGKRLEKLKIPYLPAGMLARGESAADRFAELRGYAHFAEFDDAGVALVPPGRYTALYPDGTTEEFAFVPDSNHSSRLDLKVREVTFTMTEEFHEFLGGQRRGKDRGAVRLHPYSFQSAAQDNPAFTLVFMDNLMDALLDLSPESPKTLPVPPGVYWLECFGLPTYSTYISSDLDLRDPAIDSVVVGMDGWPGTRLFDVRFAPGVIQDEDVPATLTAHHKDWRTVLRDHDGFKTWDPEGAITARAWFPNARELEAWVPSSGRYVIGGENVRGQSSLRIKDVPPGDEIIAWLAWQGDGLEFRMELKEDLQADKLPEKDATLLVRRKRWNREREQEEFDAAVVPLSLAGERVFKAADLPWQPCGAITVLVPLDTQVSMWTEPWPEWYRDSKYRHRGDHLEYRFMNQIPAEQHMLLYGNPFNRTESRTVRVQPGRATVIDLR